VDGARLRGSIDGSGGVGTAGRPAQAAPCTTEFGFGYLNIHGTSGDDVIRGTSRIDVIFDWRW
jgi:hypothetical protein